jgi:uncharacterized membrane protein YoaK (UPF0700 family)
MVHLVPALAKQHWTEGDASRWIQFALTIPVVGWAGCVSVPLFEHHNVCGVYSAACACGLQNAMVSTYSGAVVRTTHVSGMFTDLGIFLGHALRGLPVDSRRLRLCYLITSGFLCGGIGGAVAFRCSGYAALFIPGGLTAMTSLVYGLYEMRKAHRV